MDPRPGGRRRNGCEQRWRRDVKRDRVVCQAQRRVTGGYVIDRELIAVTAPLRPRVVVTMRMSTFVRVPSGDEVIAIVGVLMDDRAIGSMRVVVVVCAEVEVGQHLDTQQPQHGYRRRQRAAMSGVTTSPHLPITTTLLVPWIDTAELQQIARYRP
jgi:hypothetical protein